MVRVMSVGVLVALALVLAALALLVATAQSARADDYDECYWLNMEGISEETQQATRDGLESRGWYSAPQTASMPSTAPVAALWARWAERHEALAKLPPELSRAGGGRSPQAIKSSRYLVAGTVAGCGPYSILCST